nr:hypothetical protein [Tanacetum cinerariifolium]
MTRDEVISTTPARENDEFIKSSANDLVLIPRESEVTSVCDDLECNMPITTHFPPIESREDLGEHLDTLSMGDREIDFDHIRDIKELKRLLADDPVPVPRVFDEPLEFGDINSLDPLESTPVINESTLLVTPLPDSKEISLREVERFDPFFSLTQSGVKTRVIETPSFGFYHMPSPRPAAYSHKEEMYCYFHPHLTSSDGFDHGPKLK